jgi:predicted MFS family arabinose efflux permease
MPAKPPSPAAALPFTGYQKFVVAVLAFLQFTIILDFMVLSPLGAILLEQLGITTRQFGACVSAYAIAAGVSGILCAGFADRYDRKKLLLLFYTGFVVGTGLCGIAPNYHVLLVARIVTGLFGGVIGAISLAIVTDLFPLEMRGRVMGIGQSAFGASQVLGIPIGIALANRWGWHAPFLMIASIAALVGIAIAVKMQPVNAHLRLTHRQHPLRHLWKTAASGRYQVGFFATMLLATGGFMMMPFASAFTVHNLGVTLKELPWVYAVTGVCSIVFGPIIGRLSDRYGKYLLFAIASSISIALVLYYTRLSLIPLWDVMLVNVVLFATITGRMISASALTSAVPAPADRGAYMSISSSLQQLSGGVASYLAGLIVYQAADGRIEHYSRLGLVVATTTLLTLFLMYRVHRMVSASPSPFPAPAQPLPSRDEAL